MPQCPFCNSPLPSGAGQCSRCHTQLIERPAQPEFAPATRKEAAVELPKMPQSASHAQVAEPGESTRRESVAGFAPATRRESGFDVDASRQRGAAVATSREAAQDEKVVRFRPINRPPMAVICAVDDGKDKGEEIRVRIPRVVIGREEGNIIIPHDDGMSARHVEVGRKLGAGQWTWYVKDLDSSNGTYGRLVRSQLNHRQELLIGSRRYWFDAAPPGAQESEAEDQERRMTQRWEAVAPAVQGQFVPALVEMTPAGDGRRYALSGVEDHAIGSDASQCDVVLENDPLVSPLHLKITRTADGRWRIHDCDSTNGTWVRVTSVVVHSKIEILTGEQRFLIEVP